MGISPSHRLIVYAEELSGGSSSGNTKSAVLWKVSLFGYIGYHLRGD